MVITGWQIFKNYHLKIHETYSRFFLVQSFTGLLSVKSPVLIYFVSVHFGIIFSKLGLNPNQTDFENSRVLGNLILAF